MKPTKIALPDFERWQLENLIPAYGSTLDEVATFVLRHWFTTHGTSAWQHNDRVKKLISIKHLTDRDRK